MRWGSWNEESLDPKTLGELGTGQTDQVFYAQADAAAAVRRSHELSALLDRHGDRLGVLLRASRPGLALQLEALKTRLAKFDPKVEASISLGDELVVLSEADWGQTDGLEVLDEVPAAMVSVLDPSWSFSATSLPLDWLLQGTFLALHDEAIKRAAREQRRNGDLSAFSRLLEFLESDLHDLRDFLETDASAVFAPGSAMTENRPALESWAKGLRRVGAIESRNSMDGTRQRERIVLRWADVARQRGR